jgi:glyoxylase-like metal-dependent hydrolase (beta-lactamase superfamily II)
VDEKYRLKETMPGRPPVALNTLSVNVFTAQGKAMVGERPKPFGVPPGFDPITSTLIFGEYDAVLVGEMGTVAGLSRIGWLCTTANLETIYITHAHFDNFYGLSVVADVRVPAGISHIKRHDF